MDDQTKNQPALIENMIENFKEKIVNVNNRIVRYQNDPSSMTGELCNQLYEIDDFVFSCPTCLHAISLRNEGWLRK